MSESETRPNLGDALETIREEFGNRYPEWNRFAREASEHADAEGFDVDFFSPEVHFPIVRYPLDADTVRDQPKVTDAHVKALRSFAGGL